MLANRMMGDSDGSNDSIQEQSSEPHVVVACPACSTKFAVEASLIASYEVPKFHCSRCDSVFEFSARRKADVQPAGITDSQTWVLTDTQNQNSSTGNPFAQPRTRQETPSALKPSDFTLGAAASQTPLEPRKPFAPLEERAGLSILGLRPSAAQAASSVLTRQETLSYIQENITPNPAEDPFSLFDAPGTPISSTPAPPTAPREPSVSTLVSPHTAPPERIVVVPDSTPINSVTSAPTIEPALQTAPQTSTLGSILRRAEVLPQLYRRWVARLSVPNQSLVRLSSPVVLACAVLCVLSYAARLAPRSVDSLLAASVPSFVTGKVPHIPPSELHIQEVSLEFEKTQSREILPIVRGTVHNASEATIKDITIEALGFNSSGEVVVRAQAPLRSALAREKISDLPLETVKKFQTSLSARNSSIARSEKVAFTVALLSDAGVDNEIAFFSARVFSVGESR
jgi:predicted Zn finger-like uncharacterized protein